MRHTAIVVGLGAMGSAAAYHLARRGARVLGFDRFAPPHARGSSHGRSRIIREAYFEDPRYVPLVQQAYERWSALERDSGTRLFLRTGGLMLGPADGPVVGGALTSARQHQLPHEVLSAADVHRRFPGLRPTVDMVGVWEPRAGLLIPEAAIGAHLALAARHGAELRTDEPVLAWTARPDGVEVTTARGTYAADRLVLAAGAWMRQLVPALPLTVERNVLYWFRPAVPNASYAPDRFPVFLCEYAPGRVCYGFPDLGDGVKFALHHGDERGSDERGGDEGADPDAVEREVAPEEVAYVRALLRTLLPAADGPLADSAVCLYTNTPDQHFVLDVHPHHPAAVVASPCSGHGFKFSSAIGALLADLALDGGTAFDLTPFRLARFATPSDQDAPLAGSAPSA